MIISKKIIRIGNSIGFLVDRPSCEKLKLKKGDWVQVDIKKIQEDTK